jgi:hypothetical protein
MDHVDQLVFQDNEVTVERPDHLVTKDPKDSTDSQVQMETQEMQDLQDSPDQ